jgi:hypothetical protein
MMLAWNDYRQQVLKRIGDVSRLSPDKARLPLTGTSLGL